MGRGMSNRVRMGLVTVRSRWMGRDSLPLYNREITVYNGNLACNHITCAAGSGNLALLIDQDP
jgi:hypothetical protein